ncbi:MAG: hypothetical protein H6679_02155 [Epsilonproteobacteria bacterium]|nr:hypothetical protein [Campylobacterota bacterium]
MKKIKAIFIMAFLAIMVEQHALCMSNPRREKNKPNLMSLLLQREITGKKQNFFVIPSVEGALRQRIEEEIAQEEAAERRQRAQARRQRLATEEGRNAARRVLARRLFA